MEAAFGQVLRFTVAPGQEDAFDVLAARTMDEVAASRPGPLVYACHVLDGHPRVRVLYELHADRAAFSAHERRPHARRFRTERAKLVVASDVLAVGLMTGIGLPEGLRGSAPLPSQSAAADVVVEGPTFGQRVSQLRKRRGMSQRALAQTIGRSESWVSQVERDILPVGRLQVLQVLADALGVSIYQLEPAGLAPPPEAPRADDHGHIAEMDRARSVLVGHPALRTLLGTAGPADDEPPAPPAIDDLASAVDEAWALARDARLSDLGRALTTVLPAVEEAARHGPAPAGRATGPHATGAEDAGPAGDGPGTAPAPAGRAGTPGTPASDAGTTDPAAGGRPSLEGLRASAYQVATAGFSWSDEASAWVAAERAMATAEQAGDLWGVVAALTHLARAFVNRGNRRAAEQVVDTTLGALAPLVEGERATPTALSLAGALHLTGALVAAHEGQRALARQHVESARRLATRLGADRVDHGAEFGPTEVDVVAVAAAVELGDAGEALDVAGRVDRDALSPERRARFLVDVARAHSQRRHLDAATTALLDAESAASELVAAHAPAREAVDQLVQQAGRAGNDALRNLADRLLTPR